MKMMESRKAWVWLSQRNPDTRGMWKDGNLIAGQWLTCRWGRSLYHSLVSLTTAWLWPYVHMLIRSGEKRAHWLWILSLGNTSFDGILCYFLRFTWRDGKGMQVLPSEFEMFLTVENLCIPVGTLNLDCHLTQSQVKSKVGFRWQMWTFM